MITIICHGYTDEHGEHHECGVVLGTKPSKYDGESHTYCADCETKQSEALDKLPVFGVLHPTQKGKQP